MWGSAYKLLKEQIDNNYILHRNDYHELRRDMDKLVKALGMVKVNDYIKKNEP